MPGYRGHLVAGCGAYAIMLLAVSGMQKPVFVTVAWLFCTLVGALTPDIDISSKGQKYFYRFIFVVVLILFVKHQWVTASCISLAALIPAIVPHRGIFHRLWFWFLFSGSLLVLAFVYMANHASELAYVLLFFLTGVISHLVADRFIH